MTGAWGLLLALAVPLALLAVSVWTRGSIGVRVFLPFAPLPALIVAMLAPDAHLTLPRVVWELQFALDGPSAILLGTASLLWATAGWYASDWLRDRPAADGFAAWWLLTLTGSVGVFMAADLISFYLTFAMVSLAAWGLVVHDNTAGARRAGVLYVSLALLGEAFLLMAFVLLASATPGSLAIRDVVAALPASPWRDSTLLLLLLGFGLKLGLVPLHVWMPVAHPMAPIPASAVLSGVVVKAGVIGLIRFLPFAVALPDWGGGLAAAGLLTAFYAVVIGITQRSVKAVLAYSTVSQMGVIAAVAGMGLARGVEATPLALAVYAAHHVLVKGALFLSVGVDQTAHRRWLVLWPALLLTLSLGGAPFTGGSLAKFAIKTPLGDGVAAGLSTLSAAGTTVLMLHFTGRLARSGAAGGSMLAWLTTAIAAVAVPWGVFLATGGDRGALTFAALWAAAWPVVLGAGLAGALRRWGEGVPRCPEGDIAVFGEAAFDLVRPLGGQIERADTGLRAWPVAGVSLLSILLLLGLVLLLGA